jgi:hypothetical protein
MAQMKRRFQFSLRALLVAATIAAVSSALWRWHTNRLEALADSFGDLIHQGRYREAEAVAVMARRLYPDALIARQMENTCRIFFHREQQSEPEPAFAFGDIADWQKLVDEHRAANTRAQETHD